MKRVITIAFALFLSAQLFGQSAPSRADIRVGAGFSLLGSGDMQAQMIENELNYRLNNYFATSVGLGFGRSNRGVYETASFLQGNGSLFFSPFKNNGRSDFRIGGGLTYYQVSDAYESSRFSNGQDIQSEYTFDQRSSLGFIVAIEQTFSLGDRGLLGIKAFTQPYMNGDINSGVLLKLGVRL
ncbi:MAG: hypothetical protein AAF399_04995 [Bacteroidota bacterium]